MQDIEASSATMHEAAIIMEKAASSMLISTQIMVELEAMLAANKHDESNGKPPPYQANDFRLIEGRIRDQS